MSRSRNITDFFGRPRFPGTNSRSSEQRISDPSKVRAASSQSLSQPHLTSSLSENNSSTYSGTPTDSPGTQLKESPLDSAGDLPEEKAPHQSFQSGKTTGNSSVGGSFGSSQRLVRDGKEVVTCTDGEETDSLEDVDELLRRFTGPEDDFQEQPSKGGSTGVRMNLRPKRGMMQGKFSLSDAKAPNYKNTLDMLVTEAVDDNETEAGVAKLKAAMESENSRSRAEPRLDGRQGGGVHEDMLAAALGEKDDELSLQRLLDAVRRTEAFEREKSWLFFDHETDVPPPHEFPRDAIAPRGHLAGLRDPNSRERMFHSGIIGFAFSKDFLPDELVSWIFHSVPSEPRDDLRKAYCRAIKHVTARRVRSLIRPEDVNNVFRRLGAGRKALSVSTPIVPDPSTNHKPLEEAPIDRDALLSIFELLRGGAELFAHDTRTHVLNILFRLTLDRSLIMDTIISSELERTITATLEGIPEENVETTAHDICRSLYETVKDPSFQSRLLSHILPTSDWIALVRCRLAIAFLTQSPSPLSEPSSTLLNLRRIVDVLRGQQFDTKRYKNKSDGYDYGELSALTSLLNVAIESGVPRDGFPSKAAERAYNTNVDLLAERIKMMFTSIQGLGASHLKRALAKSALETLHYRILYSVRSKPPPKVSLFGDTSDAGVSRITMDQWVSKNANGDAKENSSKQQ